MIPMQMAPSTAPEQQGNSGTHAAPGGQSSVGMGSSYSIFRGLPKGSPARRMPVPDESWNGPAFQYTVQADYLYGYNGASPCGQEINAYMGETSQSMAPRPLQADCNTAFMAPTWQYVTEHNQFESAGCVVIHASNVSDDYYNPKNELFQDPKHAVIEGTPNKLLANGSRNN